MTYTAGRLGGVLIKNKNKICYAGPPGIQIRALFQHTTDPTGKETFNGRQVLYTHNGRGGLGLLCQHWKLEAGHEILMPAYNCGTEIDPFVHYGLKIIFYRINQQAQIDFDNLRNQVTSRTKVIYVTHYFGWPQDVQFLSDYCKKNNIYLLEDCALSLFSNPGGHPIGFLGDAAIYSFPKTLPVPDGGALTIPSNNPIPESPIESPPFGVILKKMFPLIKRAALRLSVRVKLYRYLPIQLTRSRTRGEKLATMAAGLPEMPQSYYFNKDIEKKTASRVTQYILKHSCKESIIKQRRENYYKLYDVVQKTKLLQPLFHKLPEGTCPLHLPVLVEDREAVCRLLNENGIAAIKWWAGYHRAFDWSEFNEAKYLKDHVLTIPIHQQLSPDDMEYVCSVISSIDELTAQERIASDLQ